MRGPTDQEIDCRSRDSSSATLIVQPCSFLVVIRFQAEVIEGAQMPAYFLKRIWLAKAGEQFLANGANDPGSSFVNQFRERACKILLPRAELMWFAAKCQGPH